MLRRQRAVRQSSIVIARLEVGDLNGNVKPASSSKGKEFAESIDVDRAYVLLMGSGSAKRTRGRKWRYRRR
jgi:hypothetical protein